MPSAFSRTSLNPGATSSSLSGSFVSSTARTSAGSIGPGGTPVALAGTSGDQGSSTMVRYRLCLRRARSIKQGLRGEHAADRRGERRPADLGADVVELLEHLFEPVAGTLRAQGRVEARDEPGGDVVLGGAHGDARSERRDRLVADVLVHEVRRLPQPGDVDAGVEPHAGERLRERLPGNAVQRQRERIDRACDQLRTGLRRLERRRERAAACALDVDADGQAARVRERVHEGHAALCGWSEPVGSWSSTRTAPSSGSAFARSMRMSISPVGPGL